MSFVGADLKLGHSHEPEPDPSPNWLARVFITSAASPRPSRSPPLRYETTLALPIEYGVCTALDVTSGLLFYAEYEHMSRSQLGLVVGGTAVSP